jgi:hypothetical protein
VMGRPPAGRETTARAVPGAGGRAGAPPGGAGSRTPASPPRRGRSAPSARMSSTSMGGGSPTPVTCASGGAATGRPSSR